MNQDDEYRVPLIQERARLEKRVVERSVVRINTHVESRDEVIAETLHQEEVEIRRIPMNIEVETAPTVRQEGAVTIIPIVEERVVVTKRLVLVEELHVERVASQERVEVPVTLHSTTASVERTSSSDDESADTH